MGRAMTADTALIGSRISPASREVMPRPASPRRPGRPRSAVSYWGQPSGRPGAWRGGRQVRRFSAREARCEDLRQPLGPGKGTRQPEPHPETGAARPPPDVGIRCASRSISGAAAISCSISGRVNSAERTLASCSVRALRLFRHLGHRKVILHVHLTQSPQEQADADAERRCYLADVEVLAHISTLG
jgi:hypothetical protein